MPINMIRFERLAYLSLVISLVAIVLDNATPNGAKLGPVALAVVVVVVFAFGGALISATARLRKNWLRWVYAGLFTLGVAGDIWMIPSAIAAGGNILAQGSPSAPTLWTSRSSASCSRPLPTRGSGLRPLPPAVTPPPKQSLGCRIPQRWHPFPRRSTPLFRPSAAAL
jgi:hypothetical protein